MKIYVFGNRNWPGDNRALKISDRLRKEYPRVKFVEVGPNEDLPFVGEPVVIILDVVEGINRVTLIGGSDLARLVLSPRASVHDFDLAIQLKYLKKLGKLKRVSVIGLPVRGKIDYRPLQSILRKLVAQDMHGS